MTKHSENPNYPTSITQPLSLLTEVKPGQKFEMLSYGSVYMRVFTKNRAISVIIEDSSCECKHKFDDWTQTHLPVVDIVTGRLFWVYRNASVRICPTEKQELAIMKTTTEETDAWADEALNNLASSRTTKKLGNEEEMNTQELRRGDLVVAIKNIDPQGVNAPKGCMGVVFEEANAYGDGNGPMVRFGNGGACNVRDGEVVKVTNPLYRA